MRTLLLSLAVVAGVFGFACVAHADVVHLKDGRKLEGESRWTPKGLELKTKYGTIVFKKSAVLRVEKKETPEQEYARRLKALDPADLPAALALGQFAAKHKALKAKAPALLLDVDRRAKGELTTLAKDAKPAVSLRKLRVQAADALRGLDYHLVKGVWQAPEVWYPANGYLKVGKRWYKAEEAERRRAGKRRRAAKKDARAALRAAKRSAKSLKAAREGLDEALRTYSKSQARTKHYTLEVKRLASEVKSADAERILLEAEVRRYQRELGLVRAQYTLWHDKPCKCTGGSCTCGWRKRDRALAILVTTADGVYWRAYNKLKRLKKRLAGLRGSESAALRLLAKARKTEALAKANRSVAQLDFEDAERRAGSADRDAKDRKDDLKDADADRK